LRYSGYHIPRKVIEAWDAKGAQVELLGSGTLLEQWANAVGARKTAPIQIYDLDEAGQTRHDEQGVPIPAIDPTLANAIVQMKLVSKGRFGRTGRPNKDWHPLLRGLAHFNGKAMRSDWRKDMGLGYYRPKAGPGPWIDAEIADAALIKRFAGLQFTNEMRAAMERRIRERLRDADSESLKREQVQLTDSIGVGVAMVMSPNASQIVKDAANKEIAKAQRRIAEIEAALSKPTTLQVAINKLADLGTTIGLMSPERRQVNAQRLMRQVVFNDSGEIAVIELQPWAHEAFGEIASCANDAEGGTNAHTLHIDLVWFLIVCGFTMKAHQH
jgi:hypothetical protein